MEPSEEDRRLTEIWKKKHKYHTSEDNDRNCFSCMNGDIMNLHIQCKVKEKAIPGSSCFLCFTGTCDRFVSVYLEDEE